MALVDTIAVVLGAIIIIEGLLYMLQLEGFRDWSLNYLPEYYKQVGIAIFTLSIIAMYFVMKGQPVINSIVIFLLVGIFWSSVIMILTPKEFRGITERGFYQPERALKIMGLIFVVIGIEIIYLALA